MNKKIEIQVPEGKIAEWKEINGVTTLVLTDEKDNRPVTERIKTFEDACNELGEENVLVQAYRTAEFNTSGNQNDVSDVVAYLKLRVISEALNEGWEPQFTTGEYRWYPWFYLYTQEEIDKMDEENKKNTAKSKFREYMRRIAITYKMEEGFEVSELNDKEENDKTQLRNSGMTEADLKELRVIWGDYSPNDLTFLKLQVHNPER